MKRMKRMNEDLTARNIPEFESTAVWQTYLYDIPLFYDLRTYPTPMTLGHTLPLPLG